MNERKRVSVNEAAIQQMMAGDAPSFEAQEIIKTVEKESVRTESETEPSPEPVKADDPAPDTDPSKGQKKRKSPKADFAELFLKERVVKNRKQIYISVEVYDTIWRYLKYIGDVSFIAYVDNILAHHIEEYKDSINELFDKWCNYTFQTGCSKRS